MRRLLIVIAGAGLGLLLAFQLVPRSRTTPPTTQAAPVTSRVTQQPFGGGEAPAPGSRALPRFVRKEPRKLVQNDTTAADYDPLKLSRIGHRTPDIFKAEPRVPAWAAPMERLLAGRLAADLPYYSTRARIAGVECHSSSCRLLVDVPDEDADRVSAGWQMMRPGDFMEPSHSDDVVAEGWHRQQMHVLFGKETRDPAIFARLQAERRNDALDKLRTMPEVAARLGIDLAKLPPQAQILD